MVILMDKFVTSRQKQTFYKCYFDYLDFTALLSIKEKLSVVVHCAGSSSVSMVEKNVRESFVSTVCCTNDLLEYVRLYLSLIHISEPTRPY